LAGIAPDRPESRPAVCKFSKNIRLGLRRSPQGQSYTKVCKVKFFLEKEGTLVVSRARRNRYHLSDLLAQVRKSNKHIATEWGGPAGREVW
jgi:hypothetical protein